ncbi:MAG TPA: P-II family nitrogen regulator [Bacillaceae bacterium]|nr:P-II family nitrogen regulator [Paenibacillus bovis]HLU23544.1 P-II family nitrogen regulator [Bacillaceae bacterium]
MWNSSEIADYEIVCVIVNFGLGSKILQTAKKCGISGGTVLLGKGTINNRLLNFLALSEMRKEIVVMVSNKTTADQALEELDNKYKFNKPGHGIAFTIPVKNVFGASKCRPDDTKESRGAENTMYDAITIIVEKGNAEYVIDAATEAGSKGGTIINARGSGIHETSKLFSMEIEPEKEIVMILSKKEITDAIVTSIRNKLKIDEPGNGIIFIQEVSSTHGIYE